MATEHDQPTRERRQDAGPGAGHSPSRDGSFHPDPAGPDPAGADPFPPSDGARFFLGTSGWSYPSWKPRFYPARLPASRFLEHYSRRLNTVEVNYTFRARPTAKMLDAWLAAVPARFRFSFKAPQRITHMRRLRDCGAELEAFFSLLAPVAASGQAGVLLLQLPPFFQADAAALRSFLSLPRDPRWRLAFEFRHAGWFEGETYAALEEHGAALCLAESDTLETPEVHTAGFSVYRLRRSSYSPAELKSLRARLHRAGRRGPVFAYRKHEQEPDGALEAERLLGELAPGAGGPA